MGRGRWEIELKGKRRGRKGQEQEKTRQPSFYLRDITEVVFSFQKNNNEENQILCIKIMQKD